MYESEIKLFNIAFATNSSMENKLGYKICLYDLVCFIFQTNQSANYLKAWFNIKTL